MKLPRPAVLMAVLAMLVSAPVAAQTHAPYNDHVHTTAAPGRSPDPFAQVYIVTSRELYRRGIQSITGNGAAIGRRDSLGQDLVMLPVRAHQLDDITRFVHENEKRCGGYFAFNSQAEADAFIRSDAAAQSVNGTFLASYPIDNRATVDPWLSQVVERNIYDTINHLSGYQNRYYTSSTGKSSAEWIRNAWQGLSAGRSDVTTELFTACGDCSTQPSVILTVQGSELPNEIVVIGGHLDSINSSAGGSTSQRAPGADDDASGIATLTEIIRVSLASGWKPKRTVKFMGYAAEEVGLRGSKAIAQSFKTQGRNVVGVLQLDMTNYNAGAPKEMQLVTDYSNADLKTFVVNLFDTYLAPMGHTRGTYTCGYGCSDHASWTNAGYPAAMMFEGGDSSGRPFSQIHTANDTLSNMGDSARHSVKFARLGLAFLGELGKTGGSGGGGNTLENGVAVTGLSGARGAMLRYTMQVPAGASGLKFVTGGGSGDADLYVKFGSQASTTSYDCRSQGSTNAESCSITTAQAGTYHVLVYGYSAFSGLSLSGSYGSGGATQTYSNGADYAIRDNATVESPVSVSGRSGNAPSDAKVAVNIVHTYIGDLKVDLIAPDGSVYILHNRSGGSADNIATTYTVNLSSEPLNGTWKLRVNDNYAGDTGRIDSWGVTF
ncbi:M20/M25/M40 family metallo-hydrolase [Lysobacter korlensis]|uniref:M20/M25/M40 family metallo-hydrolase n=1 Tax=Lysobacter korlensis TaxID=553636 RepID=A0ABV6RJ24_9GAMM